ncbi:MAG: oligosaccharide flippase family protein [Chloroflexia bacterium]
MLNRLSSVASTRAVSDLLVTLGGRGAQMLLGLAGNVISARALGPIDFGRFGLVMATVTICGTLADAGLTYTAIKFIAQHSERNPDRAHAVARTYMALRLLTGSLAALLGILLAAPIALFVLGQPDLTPYLQLGFATLFALSISSYPGTVLVALRLFGRLSITSVLNAAITLAGILLLLGTGHLTLTGLIAWNVLLPLASTLPAWFFLPTGWLPWRTVSQPIPRLLSALPAAAHHAFTAQDSLTREILTFSKWMLVSALGSIIVAQGDIILLGRLAGPAAVGVYSVALALALRLDTLNQSLLTIMMPRASRLETPNDIRTYTRRVLSGSLALASFLAVVALLAQPLIVLLYGPRYIPSTGLFLALTPVVLFDLATSSLFLIALPLNRPRVLAAADWLRVAVLAVSGWLLIPPFSAYGAAAARFLSRVAGAAYTFQALRHALPSAPLTPEPELEPGPEPSVPF